jgi:hypothetical protein
MKRAHIFAEFGDQPAGPPIVCDQSEVEGRVAELEQRGARVVVLDDEERVTYGILTDELLRAHPELAV